ncbi:hypothetical protein BJ165DRAFT_1439171 [Panaeolus papilionaceus]|nr:hypothetical protein BJ165DRAFT_1439171 [Panaeolus papilionaceus]
MKTAYKRADYAGFHNFLSSIESQFSDNRILAVAITRPPEIVLYIRIVLSPLQTLHGIFDSHPRPLHPNGAAFIMNSSVEATAAYLSRLLTIDSSVLSDTAMQWQAQLLSHFSGHVLIPKTLDIDIDTHSIIYDATATILRLRSELEEAKINLMNSMVETESLRSQVEDLSRDLEKGPQWSPTLQSPSQSSASSIGPATQRDDASIDPYQLQAMYDAEDSSLTSERRDLLHRYGTSFQCGICFDDHPNDYLCQIVACETHKFCRECLTSYVKTTLGSRKYPIFCPSCAAEGIKEATVELDDIASLGLSAEELDVFQELQLAVHSILVHCRKCRESIFIDRQEYTTATTLYCPLPRCDHLWCKLCQQSIPITGPEHSCDGSSELKDLMKRKGWRHCPGCETPIQRESGCNHMTCLSPGCNAHFCYLCGMLITVAVSRSDIKNAVSSHYRCCQLFEH